MVYQRSGYSIVLGKNFHEEDYKVLLGLLNTSLTCYYLKQICFKKKPTDDSIRDGYEFASEQVGTIPIPDQAFVQGKNRERFRVLVEETLQCVEELKTIQMSKIFEQSSESYYAWNNIYCSYDSPHTVIKAPFTNMDDLIAIRQKIIDRTQNIHARMIFLQEEMDWLAYEAYGLIPKAPLAEGYLNEIDYKTALLSLGQRPFEIAGKVYKGDWLPGYQPVPLQDFLHTLIESRIAIIQSNPDIATIENPLYKRRWIPSDYDKEFQEAAVWWLGEKLEYALENYGEPITLREWSRLLRDDERINTVLEMLTGSPIFNLETELLKVIRANAVSNRPEHYLKLSGLRKMNGGLFPATELTSGDFNDPVAWKLRGKLNIPRERFIAYREFDHRWRYAGFPESGGPWFGWAGWRPVQRAEALASLLERANRAGWEINYRQCGLRASLRDLLTELKDLPEAERSEFEAISVACGIGLDSHCYCEAYQAACTQGGLCAPGVSAEVLGIKILDGLTYKPHRGRSKGVEKPIQMELDL
jgi:hypothetical protein